MFGVLLVLMLQRAPDGLWPLIVRRSVAAPPERGPAREPWRRAGRRRRRRHGPAGGRQPQKTFGGLVAVNDIGFAVRAGG